MCLSQRVSGRIGYLATFTAPVSPIKTAGIISQYVTATIAHDCHEEPTMPSAYDPSRRALYHPEQSETIFRNGQSYSPLQLAVEAARLAYYRAEESPAERARLAAALSRVGFSGLTLLVDPQSGAAAFAARRSHDGMALLSFRGTRPDDYRDLITDLRANLVAWPESAGRVHDGFAIAVRALRPQIADWIEFAKADGNELILTGHSLGAALATLAASIWRPGWLVTLGSPRVGDREFVASVDAAHRVRLVDCCDAVTDVPPELDGYTHVGASAYLTRRAAMVENPDRSLVISDRCRARVEYFFQYSWQVWRNVLVRDLADHAPANYARCVFDPAALHLNGGGVAP
jgi:Lipase (class 3)